MTESVKDKKISILTSIWSIPLMAFIMGIYLVYSHISSKGPLVTISFSEAPGLQVGKTKVKYKDVEVGIIETIEISDDKNSVLVYARMQKNNTNLLHKDTQFWVVRPRLELTHVSGLETVLSGSYITLSPGKEGKAEDLNYEGLSHPPLVSQNTSGINITLLANNATSISAGTKIYYKGVVVGSVKRKYFGENYLWTKLDIFIQEPYDKILSTKTKFWSMSGVSFSSTADGFSLHLDSIEALLIGGISFNDSPENHEKHPVNDGDEFLLYESSIDAKNDIHGEKIQFVSYFDGNIKGLSKGSKVTFQGIDVGQVKNIQLFFDNDSMQPIISVIFEIYKDRFSFNQKDSVPINKIIEGLIQNGIQAKLEIGSLITMSKVIALDFHDDANSKDNELVIDDLTGQIIIPTAPESFSAIKKGATKFIERIDKFPLDDIGVNINEILKNINGAINNNELAELIQTMNSTIKQFNSLAYGSEKSIDELKKSLLTLSTKAKSVLSGYSPDNELYYNLNKAIETLNTTIEKYEQIGDKIERKPNSLILGD